MSETGFEVRLSVPTPLYHTYSQEEEAHCNLECSMGTGEVGRHCEQGLLHFQLRERKREGAGRDLYGHRVYPPHFLCGGTLGLSDLRKITQLVSV